MNKTAIKNFAIWARNKLIADIQYRAGLIGITAESIKAPLSQSTGAVEFYDIGTSDPYSITGDAIRQRKTLVEILRRKEKDTDYATAYKYILEEVAYTWFNRLIAIRFMEVNDYLPSHIRVLSSESGKIEPDLVTTPFDAELAFTPAEEEAVLRLKTENKLDELFRLLFIKQCNALNEILPGLFEKTSDYTELLLNLSVVDREGVVYRLVHDIDEDDFNIEKGGQVEIIGWLYQYYNTEPKNAAFAKNGKITKEEIPAVTQLFTPDWIVRYMVENSLGRLWIDHLEGDQSMWHLDDGKVHSVDEHAPQIKAFKDNWKYYLEEAEQPISKPDSLWDPIWSLKTSFAELKPEDITLIDPCMGSGHILVYAFDVLMQIYESQGWSQRDAAVSIVERNLFGLDIDERAAQLAYFAVMMKARQYDRRFLTRGIRPRVYTVEESNNIRRDHLKYFGGALSELERNSALVQMEGLLDALRDGKNLGSLLTVDPMDWDLLRRFVDSEAPEEQLSFDAVGLEDTQARLRRLIDVGEVLSRQYHVVVTNPPYMGSANMNAKLSEFVKKNYPDTKSDMSTVMMERTLKMCKYNGFMSMINIPVWMFLSSYEKLREHIITENTIINMVHPGRGIFGSDFGTTSFVIGKEHIPGYKGSYCRLFDKQGEVQSIEEREQAFLSGKGRYTAQQENFSKIPGSPVAYWVSDALYACFGKTKIKDVARARSGMSTTDNERFLRFWYEIDFTNAMFDCLSLEMAKQSNLKWFPYNKGGDFRKWYGNNSYLVNWANDGIEIKYWVTHNPKDPKTTSWSRRIFGTDCFFKKGITWSSVTIGEFSCRCYEEGFIFDSGANGLFAKVEEDRYYLAGLLNSKVAANILKIINPTINNGPGSIEKISAIIAPDYKCCVDALVQGNITISKRDWDSYETSWDFKRHPLV